jgi:hypothetical protein
MFALCIFSNYTVGGATVESGSVPACFFKQRQESYKNSDFGLVTVETSMPANNYAALTKIFNSSLKSSNLFETSTSEHKIFSLYAVFFANYTVYRRYSQHMHTHPYEHTRANPTPRSIFEDLSDKSSRLTKSPQVSRCRPEHRLPLKVQTPLKPE